MLSATINRVLSLKADDRYVLRALVSVAFLLFVAKAIGAAKEVAVAARYGTSPIVDAFVLVQSLVSWPVSLWAGIASTLLIPMLVRLRTEGAEARAFTSEVLGLSLGLGCLIAAAAGALAAVSLHHPPGNVDPRVFAIARLIFLPMLLIVPLGLISGVYSAAIMAGHRTINSVLDGMPSLIVMLAVVAFSPISPWPIVVGAIAGYALQNLASGAAARIDGRPCFPAFGFKSPHWREFWGGLRHMALGQIAGTGAGVVDQIMLSQLGAGANSSYGYADRVMSLLLTLGAAAIARATLPILSRSYAEGSGGQWALAARWSRILFIGGLATSVSMWFGGPLLIRLLYLRGHFTSADADNVATIFRYGLVQLPFYFPSMVFVQLIASRRRYDFFLYLGLFQLAIKIAGNVLLMPSLGPSGIALAAAVRAVGSLVFIWWFARRLGS